jgi:EAL domain-containing protein (putative c-di-GMP-specific phosphodiesterase class I)
VAGPASGTRGARGLRRNVPGVVDNSQRRDRKELAVHLRRVIGDGEEFELEYQPIFDLRGETIIGVEALLRWQRPTGAMGPAEFMPLAEAHRLTGELGQLALRRAVEEIRPFKGLMLGVNVATSQFDDPGFPQQVQAILAEAKFPVRRLQIEIDQSLLASKQRAAGIIDDLRNSGVCVALDDFVAGQSSIGYLRQFNLDRVSWPNRWSPASTAIAPNWRLSKPR